MIHEIFRPKGITNPLDFMIIIGKAAQRMGALASTKVGSAALRDLFAAPGSPQLTRQAIKENLERWGTQTGRTIFREEDSFGLYEVFLSPADRRLHWSGETECQY